MRLIALSVAMAVTAACGIAHGAEPLKVVERATGETPIDVAPKGDSPGDQVVFLNPIFDAANKTQVGQDEGYCVRITPGKSYDCTLTLKLGDGLISFHGMWYDSGDSVLFISGGSGKYLAARGIVKVHPREGKPDAYDLAFEFS